MFPVRFSLNATQAFFFFSDPEALIVFRLASVFGYCVVA